MKRIYMDNAATTEISSAAINAMTEAWKTYGNPSSLHGAGREAFFMLDKAREDVANALGADKKEIYFTSGGSESDNWAIIGAAKAMALNVTYVAWGIVFSIPVNMWLFSTPFKETLPTAFAVLCSLVVLICGIFAAADFKEIFKKRK